MLIRNVNKNTVVFVHVAKTGGTSIRAAFGGTDEDCPRSVRHFNAARTKAFIGDDFWNEAKTFAVTRNPWSRMVSVYRHAQTEARYLLQLGDASKGFDEFVRTIIGPHGVATYGRPISDFLSSGDGDFLVQHVLRFEFLQHDFSAFTETIGQRLVLPHLRAQSPTDYRTWYSDTLAEEVAQHFARDCALWGYHF